MTITERVLSMAGRTTGVASDEVDGFDRQQVGHACNNLMRKGRLHAARISHKSARYFTHIGLRDAFLASIPKPASEFANKVPTGPLLRPDAPVVIPDHVKVQVCPGFSPRFQSAAVPGAPRSYYGAAGRLS